MSVLYPNVPLAIAGVPAVLRRAETLSDAQETLADAQNDISNTIASFRWGVFDQSGTQVLEPDSFGSFEFGLEYRLADYPLEGGGFESYDKVSMPFDTRISLAKGGKQSDREAFLTTVHTLADSTDLYNIVTPERTYLNVNIERVGLVRNATNGAGMLTVELLLREIRAAAKAQFSKTKQDTVGSTAPVSPTPPVTAAPKTVQAPAATRRVNQGAAQPKTVVNPGVRLETTSTGRKLYVYDKPPGT